MTPEEKKTSEALHLLKLLGLPKQQHNERTARTLLALLNLSPEKQWKEAENSLIGIRAILDFSREKLGINYAENTRESIRKYSVKQLVDSGIALSNPDNPMRPTNSKDNCYKIEDAALKLFKCYNSENWEKTLNEYLKLKITLQEKYAKERKLNRIPLKTSSEELTLSPGEHSELIKKIIEDFGSRFVPGGVLVYVGDTGSKWGYSNEAILNMLDINVGNHGKMPDVIMYDQKRNWLILIEAVTSTGPVDGGRYSELKKLFTKSKAGLVFVTAFPDRERIFRKYLSEVAWESEVWCASDPTHLIHFNGSRFLGPY